MKTSKLDIELYLKIVHSLRTWTNFNSYFSVGYIMRFRCGLKEIEDIKDCYNVWLNILNILSHLDMLEKSFRNSNICNVRSITHYYKDDSIEKDDTFLYFFRSKINSSVPSAEDGRYIVEVFDKMPKTFINKFYYYMKLLGNENQK